MLRFIKEWLFGPVYIPEEQVESIIIVDAPPLLSCHTIWLYETLNADRDILIRRWKMKGEWYKYLR